MGASHWKDIPIHILDFEGSYASGIVEYGAVTLLNGQVVDCATRVCRPDGVITPVERSQHGIEHDVALREKPFHIEWDRFVNLRKSGPLGAHHASVEQRFLKGVWPYPPASPDFRQAGGECADWGPWVDTRQLYTRVYPDVESHSLGKLIATFNLQARLDAFALAHCPPERSRYHCALYDALASALLLIYLCTQRGFEHITIGWLLQNSLPSQAKRDAARQGDLFS